MTAIFGLIHHDSSPVPPALILATRQSMAHHAEHGMETWQGKKALLGQALTRFWRNSARTATPEQDPARGLTLVADARLDNRADLANRLRLSSADLASLSDTRLLLYAYRAWGEETPRYLRGDFVFAVWDGKNQSLFAARDPIGIRWFYYNAGPRRFAFASDPAGLLELMEEDPCLDLDTLDGFLTFQNNAPIETTLYQNVHKLQPGESLRLRDGALQTFRYWQAENITPMPLPKDPREGAQVLRGLLREAVANRAQTTDRLGAHLSGGLDSSALAALAAQIQRQSGGQDPLAFSWSPPLEMRPLMEKDERVYAQSIADHLHLPVTYTHVPPLVDAIQETSDPSLLPINTVRFEQTIMENARQQGVRVLLSGWGGDELVFSRGIGYPSGLIQRGRFLALALYFKR
jgi:asparagine synthase (glutamine-hydrolysing)